MSLNGLIKIEEKEGKLLTTSLNIAEVFGREHSKILRAIKSLPCSEEFIEANFGLNEYNDSIGRSLPMYIMTRDGWSFLVMGFTGEKAAQFKEAYIKEFNRMESQIKKSIAPTNIFDIIQSQLDILKTIHTKVDYHDEKIISHDRIFAEINNTQKEAKRFLEEAKTPSRVITHLSTREKIREIVNAYCAENVITQKDAFAKLYKDVYYNKGINLRQLAKKYKHIKNISLLEVAEKESRIEEVYSSAYKLFVMCEE